MTSSAVRELSNGGPWLPQYRVGTHFRVLECQRHSGDGKEGNRAAFFSDSVQLVPVPNDRVSP